MEIGTVLAQARKAAGVQQKDLAQQLGMSPSYLCDLELGKRPLLLRWVISLPDPIRPPVASAMIESMMADVEVLRQWAY